MNAIERELKTARGFASCRADEDCLDEALLELERLLRIEEAAMNICSGHIGKAIRIDDSSFQRIADILNEHRPRNTAVPPAPTPNGFEEEEI